MLRYGLSVDFVLQIHGALLDDAKSERSLAEDYQYRER